MNSGRCVESSRAAILARFRSPMSCSARALPARTLDESMQALSSEVRRWLPPAKRAGAGS
jgi:hypothetical protein